MPSRKSNNFGAVSREQRRRAALIASVESYKTALSFTQGRYSAGSSSLQNVLDAQRYLYSAREADAQSALSLVSAYTALCKSLGGGRQREG
jgi:outer membrane protein TolC